MKERSKYQLGKYSDRLLTNYHQATDEEIAKGKDWYPKVNKFITGEGIKWRLPRIRVGSVVSILSPRNKWEQNLLDAQKVLSAHDKGIHPDQIKVCTFNKNKYKAFKAARGDIEITDQSLKTYNFVNNIAHLCPESLTIDIWHLRACLGKNIKIDKSSIGRVAYQQIKSLTIKLAHSLGLEGYEFQAIVWLSTQRLTKK